MIAFLSLLTLLLWFFGAIVFMAASGALHQILALIIILMGVATFCSAAILSLLDKIKAAIADANPRN